MDERDLLPAEAGEACMDAMEAAAPYYADEKKSEGHS